MNIFLMLVGNIYIWISDIMDMYYTNQESPNDDNGGYTSPNFSSHDHIPSDIQSG